MPSIVPGFEYDIFISYRHKDNKYDGWVTEFIDNLKKEIEATFKEDISIYFDVNPHDGLLETHDVDGSLKDKLKCLIFIPIISRTYCDPKSFAWNNEFVQFLKSASTDAYGLKVRLPKGNMASRVLPIRIHELDTQDKKIIEAELQGPLRAIDFTFQTAGVNRPLRPKDDETNKGPGQSSYRDQINKTANAINDIIAGLQSTDQGTVHSANSDDVSQADRALRKIPKKSQKFRLPEFNISRTSIALVISVLAFIVLAVIHFSESPHEDRTYRSTILPPENTRFTAIFGSNSALSPDGRTLAFLATDSADKTNLWVRKLNAGDAQMLAGTEGAQLPFWSPDNHFIGFAADGKLKKIKADGGLSQTICDIVLFRGGTWNEEGRIVFSGSSIAGLSSVSSAGGPVVRATKLDTTRNEISHRWPVFLPDGRHFLFTTRGSASGVTEQDAIFLASLDTTVAPQLIVNARSNGAYANGCLLFARDQSLMAQTFDKVSMQTSGDALPIAEHVYYDELTSMSAFTVSQNGNLVYQEDPEGTKGLRLVWRDRAGKQTSSIIPNSNFCINLRLSPDGNRIAVSHPDGKSTGLDTWLFDINRSLWTRFAFNDATDRDPVWSPDGQRIVFASDRNKQLDLFLRASNGAGSEILLFESEQNNFPSDWSSDGKFIAFLSNETPNNNDIWILPMDPNLPAVDRKPFIFLKTPFNEVRPTFSPDGHWIAYQSNETGRMEIYVRPFPGPGGKWQVSTSGGSRPHWRGDGKELFFIRSDFRIMAAEIKSAASALEVGAVNILFKFRNITGGTRDLFDVTSDGQRFLIESAPGDELTSPFTLVVNWPGEIKRK